MNETRMAANIERIAGALGLACGRCGAVTAGGGPRLFGGRND